MEDVRDFFKETDNCFTIYVVEQRFVIGRGAEYFRSYKGKINYIDCNTVIKKRLSDILRIICKHVPDTGELIKSCFGKVSPTNIIDVISLLSKLFSVNEHQAAGPDVIDPIIIQEGNILPKYINQLIELHRDSILRPAIIILLKDNNFDRAKDLLSNCPHNTNIKMIRNSGETELYKTINPGAENPDAFLDAFANQCFSTCSNTKRKVLYNDDWAENSIIKCYSPEILKIRTQLLFRDKTLVKKDLNYIIDRICSDNRKSEFDQKLLQSYECILKLFRVFCNDGGTKDMDDSYQIAKNLDNDILLAHVYRNSYFFDNISFDRKIELMDEAYNIFSQNQMEDHAIYCKNNKIVRQFDTDYVSTYDFLDLQEEAIHNVPGLVGMAHILNNTGAALLTNGAPDEAIPYFDKGLDYAHRPERIIQKIALLSNKLIAQAYCFTDINESELRKVLQLIFDNKEALNLPFLTARYALNIVAVAFNKNRELGRELLRSYPINTLIKNSLATNPLGSGQLLLQISVLKSKYGQINELDDFNKPLNYLEAKGIRKDFIAKNTYNPCSFSTWF